MAAPELIDTTEVAINITIELTRFIHTNISSILTDIEKTGEIYSEMNQALRIKLYYRKKYGSLFSTVFYKAASLINFYDLKYIDDETLIRFLDYAIMEVVIDKLELYIINNNLPISPAMALSGVKTCTKLAPITQFAYYGYDYPTCDDLCVIQLSAAGNKIYASIDNTTAIFYIMTYDLSNNNYCYFNIVDVRYQINCMIVKFEILGYIYFAYIDYLELLKIYGENSVKISMA